MGKGFIDCPGLRVRRLKEQIRQERKEWAAKHLIVYCDGDMVMQHRCNNSMFCRACVRMGYLTQQQMEHAAARYQLGMSRDGGVIFWQLDLLGLPQDGKIMYYRDDCHRDHSHNPTWVWAELKRYYFPANPEAADIVNHRHCFFGMHLYGKADTVCIVEAEKTAVILSEYYPQHVWMAAGGINELTVEKLRYLSRCRVVLFPDTDKDGRTFRLWYDIAQQASKEMSHPIYVSPILEQRATMEQKERKIDLVDLIFEGKPHPRPLSFREGRKGEEMRNEK